MRLGVLALAVATIGLPLSVTVASAQQIPPSASLPECQRDDPDLLLPDLVPDAPSSVRNLYQGSRRILQFTTAVGNVGDGPLVIEGRTVSTPEGLVTQGHQIIRRRDGSMCARQTGRFEFHPGHGHFHFDAFVGYELRTQDPFTGPLAATGTKASFCLLDIENIRGFPYTQFPRQVVNQTCASAEGIQGISVGWKDVYERFLPGQLIELDQSPATQVPSGGYYLVNVVDPNHLLWDKNPDNNTAFVLASVSLPPLNIATAPPPATPRPINPKLKPGRVRPTRVPRPTRAPRVPLASQPTPVPTPPPTPRVATPVVPTPVPPTAVPTAPPPPVTGCENACAYSVSQIRMTWYGALSLSALVKPGPCQPLTPETGEQGTLSMTNWLTDRKVDTGHQHVATYTLGNNGAGDTSLDGFINFSRVTNAYRIVYSAPVPSVAGMSDGANFPVVFNLCLTVGEQAVKTRLVCQPKPQGMLCHSG